MAGDVDPRSLPYVVTAARQCGRTGGRFSRTYSDGTRISSGTGGLVVSRPKRAVPEDLTPYGGLEGFLRAVGMEDVDMNSPDVPDWIRSDSELGPRLSRLSTGVRAEALHRAWMKRIRR